MSRSRKPAGLKNIGSTCYLNSVLQCLLYCLPLIQTWHVGHEHTPITSEDKPLTYQLFTQVQKNIQEDYHYALDTSLILSILQQKVGGYQLGKQQDASECILHLLDILDQEWKTPDSGSPVSMVKYIFQGCVEYNYSCPNNHQFSHSDPFLLLAMAIPPEKRYTPTVVQGLINHMDKELLEFQCASCGEKEVECLSHFSELPGIMWIVLKRFSSQGGKSQQMLEALSTFTVQDKHYHLWSLIYHHGPDMESGHYTAAVKLPHHFSHNNGWYSFNDTTVEAIKESELDTRNAYLLGYIVEDLVQL